MTHAQKIQAAMVAYLAGQDWPETLQNEASQNRIFSGESDGEKDGQCIICSVEMQEEFPQYSGNRYSICTVDLRTPAADPTSIDSHETAAILLDAAISADDLLGQLNSSGPGLTVMGLLDRQQSQDQDDDFHSHSFTFRIYSCPSALDGATTPENSIYTGSVNPNGNQIGNVGDEYNQIVDSEFVQQWIKTSGYNTSTGWT